MTISATASPPRTVLLTNVWLRDAGGTECVVRDLALGLRRRGHHPLIYSPNLGAFAESLRAEGLTVVDDLAALPKSPDVIHAHHRVPAAEAIIQFPDAPVFYVCHSWRFWVEQPPLFPQIRRYGGVSEFILRHMELDAALLGKTVFLPNAVDLARFPPRPTPLRDTRPRLLTFHGGGLHRHALETATARLRLPLTSLGRGGDRMTNDPAFEFHRHDIVLATGRSALEAMACGCAVIVAGEDGMAGFVTDENFDWFRACNFAKTAFTRPCTADELTREIRGYDPAMAARVSLIAREQASLERQLDRVEEIHTEILAEAAAAPVPPDKHRDAVHRFLKATLPRVPGDKRWPWEEERQWMSGEIEHWKQQHAAIRQDLTQAQEEARQSAAQTQSLEASLTQALTEARSEVAALRQSSSWRITRPLRAVRGLFGRE